jgi:O-antigen/teichoic acid export membrane protein
VHARKSFLIFTTNMVGAVLGLASLFFVGRYMTDGAFGAVHFAIWLIGLASFLVKLGLDKAHEKRVSEGRDLAACMGTYLPIKIALIAAFTVITLALVLGRHLTVGFVAATAFPVVIVILIYHVLMAVRSIPETTFNALRLTASTQAMNVVENLLRAPFIILVALAFAASRGRSVPFGGLFSDVRGLVGGGMDDATGAFYLALAYAIPMLASLVIGLRLMFRHRLPRGEYDPELARSYVAFALPVAGYSALLTLSHNIDGVMLGYFWTKAEVGQYAMAFRLVTIVMIIPVAVRTLFFPMINELVSRREWGAVNEMAVTTQRLTSLVMLPILMLTVLYAHHVFRIFIGAQFVPASDTLRLLVLHAVLAAFTTISTSIILGMDRPGLIATVATFGVGLNVALNVVFIPQSVLGVPMFGLKMAGAALATVIAKTFTMTIYFWLSRRFLGTTHFSRSSVKHILAAALAGLALWSAEHYLPFVQVVRIWELAGASTLGLAIYGLLLILMRELKRKDWLFLIDLLHPGRMGKYVKGELRGQKRSS